MTRRQMLASAALLPTILPAERGLAADFWSLPRSIWLHRAGTRESFKVVYFADGKLIEEGYSMACWLLRDLHEGTSVRMSLVLLDILCGMHGWFRAAGFDLPIVTTSGYRSPRTNAATEGAARNSLHQLGRAHDGYVPGVPTDVLAKLGLYLRGGGVGWYPTRSFVHVDDGGLRVWKGR